MASASVKEDVKVTARREIKSVVCRGSSNNIHHQQLGLYFLFTAQQALKTDDFFHLFKTLDVVFTINMHLGQTVGQVRCCLAGCVKNFDSEG